MYKRKCVELQAQFDMRCAQAHIYWMTCNALTTYSKLFYEAKHDKYCGGSAKPHTYTYYVDRSGEKCELLSETIFSPYFMTAWCVFFYQNLSVYFFTNGVYHVFHHNSMFL